MARTYEGRVVLDGPKNIIAVINEKALKCSFYKQYILRFFNIILKS